MIRRCYNDEVVAMETAGTGQGSSGRRSVHGGGGGRCPFVAGGGCPMPAATAITQSQAIYTDHIYTGVYASSVAPPHSLGTPSRYHILFYLHMDLLAGTLSPPPTESKAGGGVKKAYSVTVFMPILYDFLRRRRFFRVPVDL